MILRQVAMMGLSIAFNIAHYLYMFLLKQLRPAISLATKSFCLITIGQPCSQHSCELRNGSPQLKNIQRLGANISLRIPVKF